MMKSRKTLILFSKLKRRKESRKCLNNNLKEINDAMNLLNISMQNVLSSLDKSHSRKMKLEEIFGEKIKK
jgi:uncharacterized membrane protein YcjF (UPF0283 family)